ncbi:SGNH/GDSL hydrolase family protein [Croceibacterium ferulae]|uniref:SGNH/GDSL hydrolase family protein n=1 Tax=Croceibacterium ferulae TaxID=1854641 RepID=UPI00138FC8A3|nr:SGNH/GDSL hydrolase family protein [Croceibacterium ferulae]
MAAPAHAERQTEQFTSVTVFGDSLVDAGNYYIATEGAMPDPALGYHQNRFTNGFNYPDLLSLELFGVPTTPSLLGGNNFGFAAARIIDTGDDIPDLQAQLGAFQASDLGVDPDGLYIMNFGGNDVFGALGVFGPDAAIGSYSDVSSYLRAAAEQYVAGVRTLLGLGARNILMTDFPLAGHPLTIEANAYLDAELANLAVSDDTDFLFYSLSDYNQNVLANPDSYGLPPLRTDTSCIAAGAQATGCAGFYSFDGIHPTAAVQAAGYRDINRRFGLTAVQAVPEPAGWAMMCFGFGVLGAALRIRRRSARTERNRSIALAA